MSNKSFLNKFIILLIIIALIAIIAFFVINKNEVNADIKNLEAITSMNVETKDEDMYVYKIDNNKIYVSDISYNRYYLLNRTVDFIEYDLTENTKFYVKTLSNTEKDITNIKISYDPIDMDEFQFFLENYTSLKVYIWFDNNKKCKNILLYSAVDIQLEVENY